MVATKGQGGGQQHDTELLVRDLTLKLEQLRAVVERESIASNLQQQLAALLIPSAPSSPTTSYPSLPSSPSSAPSYPPPSFTSTLAPPPTTAFSPPSTSQPPSDNLSSALFAALQREKALQAENLELRSAYNQAERWRGELVELRKRCGISVEELEDGLSPEGTPTSGGSSGSRGGGGGAGHTGSGASPSPSDSFGSFSSSTSHFMNHGRRRSTDSSSRYSYSTSTSTSRSRFSVSTVLTTPSSSYPITAVPQSTPQSSVSSLPPIATLASPPTASTSGHTSRANTNGRSSAIEFDDLLPSPTDTRESSGRRGVADSPEPGSGNATPLSVSPGSRSGSLSRRPSLPMSKALGFQGPSRVG
ncbi:hypothetical protein MNV49_001335 [Pseudohyphozyma bogoriensis]|nr:hypothetical protein MNV49_001335 [Pseudohyphozyma bogoriensis]